LIDTLIFALWVDHRIIVVGTTETASVCNSDVYRHEVIGNSWHINTGEHKAVGE